MEGTNDFGMEISHRGGTKGIIEVLQGEDAYLRGGIQQERISATNRNQRERVSLLPHPVQQKEGTVLLSLAYPNANRSLQKTRAPTSLLQDISGEEASTESRCCLSTNIPVKEVSDLLVVSQDRAKRFELTPVWAPVEPPTKQAKTAEVRLSSASNVPMPPTKDDNEKGSSDEEDSDSPGSNSDVSSQDDSDVSIPNDEVPGIDLPGGMKALHSLANVPKSWPLARLTIPLSAASKHLERLLDLQRTWWSCLLSIWLRQFLRCFGMYWTILARSSMILRLNPCSYLSSGSTPSTGKCLTQLLGIDLASLWS